MLIASDLHFFQPPSRQLPICQPQSFPDRHIFGSGPESLPDFASFYKRADPITLDTLASEVRLESLTEDDETDTARAGKSNDP
jgi:hypothetical protein